MIVFMYPVASYILSYILNSSIMEEYPTKLKIKDYAKAAVVFKLAR